MNICPRIPAEFQVGYMADEKANRPKATIFYSWQSDLPNATNRGFILRALEDAIKVLHVDDSVAVEPVLDRDTQGQSGSPNIAETIFRKIDQAAVFVADASMIGTAGEYHRPTPNPNVLVELGYGLKTLGGERVLLVVNAAFGKVELLPFDLRMRRVLSYNMPVEGQRGDERRALQRSLEDALKATLAAAQPPAPPVRSFAALAMDAVEQQAPNQSAVVRRYMEWLTAQVTDLTPHFEHPESSEFDDLLVAAIDASNDLVADFGAFAQRVAEMGAADAARAVYEGFSGVVQLYNKPQGFSGSFLQIEFDLAKFLGHELFVTFFTHLVREECWDIVSDLLDRGIFVANPSDGRPRALPFTTISQYVELFDVRNRRLNLRRISLHADLVNQRHSAGRIGDTAPMGDFVAADLFLNLRAAAAAGPSSHGFDWRPWSLLYLRHAPRFVYNATLRQEAEKLLRPLRLSDIDALRALLAQRLPQQSTFYGRDGWFWHNPLADFNPQSVGMT